MRAEQISEGDARERRPSLPPSIPPPMPSARPSSQPPPLTGGGPLGVTSPLADEDSMLGSAELQSFDEADSGEQTGHATFLSQQRQQLAQGFGRIRDRIADKTSSFDTWPRRSLIQLGGLALLVSSLLTCLLAVVIARGCGDAPPTGSGPDLSLTVAAHTATTAALGAVLQACAHDGTAKRAAHWFVPERRDALLRDACRLQKLAQGMTSFEAVAALPISGSEKGKLASGLGIEPADCLELALESGSVSACFSGTPPRYQILDFEIDPGS